MEDFGSLEKHKMNEICTTIKYWRAKSFIYVKMALFRLEQTPTTLKEIKDVLFSNLQIYLSNIRIAAKIEPLLM